MPYSIVNITYYNTGNSSDTFTIPSTTTGNLLVALAQGFPGTTQKWQSPNFLKTDVTGQFTEVPYWGLQGGSAWDWAIFPGSGPSSADILYQVTAGGDTVVSFTSDHPVFGLVVYEIAGWSGSVNLDDYKIAGSASAVAPFGPALSGSGSTDLLFLTITEFNSQPSGISSPWTDNFTNDNQTAYILGGSGTQSAPSITCFSGTDRFTTLAVAFNNASSGPHISGISPSCGLAGTTVTITGTSFGSTQGGSTVTFNGVTASVSSWSDTSIVVVAPSSTTGPVVVTTSSASNSVTFTYGTTVSITNLSPNVITYGSHPIPVTITGTGFGASQGGSTVFFNGVDLSSNVTSWSSTAIVVSVPPTISTGNVVVTVSSCSTNGVLFTVNTPASNCTTDAGRLVMDSTTFGTGIVNQFASSFDAAAQAAFLLGRTTAASDRLICGTKAHYLIGGAFNIQSNAGFPSSSGSYQLLLNGSVVASAGSDTDSALEVDLNVGDYIQINVVTSPTPTNAAAAHLFMVQLPGSLSSLTSNPSLYETFNSATITPNFTTVLGFVNFANVIPTHAGGAHITTQVPNSGSGAGQQNGGLALPAGNRDAIYLLTGTFAGISGAARLCAVSPETAYGYAPMGGVQLTTATNSNLAQTPLPSNVFNNVMRANYFPGVSGQDIPGLAFRTTQDTSSGAATVQVSGFQLTYIFPFCGCGGGTTVGNPLL